MLVRELFIEYRGEFHDLFVDVEDQIAALIQDQQDPECPVSVPGPDVISALRDCFASTDYNLGPARPVSLLRAVCRDEKIDHVLRGCSADVGRLIAELAELEEAKEIVFQGWLPQLFRRHWHRGTWSEGLAHVLALAALEGASRHRTTFSCVDVLLMLWSHDPAIRGVLESSRVTRGRIRNFVSHGTPDPLPMPSLEGLMGPINIRMQYEIYCSGPLFAHILIAAFGVLDPEPCLQRLHDLGWETVGPFEIDDAAARLQLARSIAMSEDAPLLLTVESLAT